MDLVNQSPDAAERGKRILVNVSNQWDYQSKKKCYTIAMTGARFSTSHGIEVEECEKLYYQLRWILQDAGTIPLGPFIYKVVLRLHASYKVKKDRLATYYVVANTEADAKQRLHDLDYNDGGISLVSISQLELTRRGARVAVIADPGISGVIKEEVVRRRPTPRKKAAPVVEETSGG